MSTSIANTPFGAFLQHGGELTPAQRLQYITSCDELSCTRNYLRQKKLLEESIQVLLDLSLEKINALSGPVKAEMLAGFQKVKTDTKVNSLQDFNLISLQIVLLFEFLTYKITPKYKSTYVNEEITKGCKVLLKFPQIWLNRRNLQTLILNPPDLGINYTRDFGDNFETYFRNKFQIDLRPTKSATSALSDEEKAYLYELLHKNYLKNLIQAPQAGGCCLVGTNSFMLVPLGELTIVELLDSFFRKVYLCGIVFGLEYADGTLHTPFEFMIHDIIHAKNFMDYGVDKLELLKGFFEEIKKVQSKIDVSVFDKLMLVLFIIIHESMNMYMFERKINKSLWDSLSPGFLTDIRNWKNKHFFGGLLPPGMIEKSDIEIKTYLKETFDFAAETWNRYVVEKDLSFLIPEDIIPSMGRNSAMEALFQNGGKRRKTKKRQMKKHKTRRVR